MNEQYARRTKLKVIYEKRDITKDLVQNLISLTYTDNEEKEADDLQLTIEDRKSIWVNNYLKAGGKGAQIKASIIEVDENRKEKELFCGTFAVDTINQNGPPNKITIKATSIPTTSKIISEKKNKAWENIKLSEVAREIAEKNKLQSKFESQYDPLYDRREQTQKSDLTFLEELAQDAGISLKVTDEKIVLFDAEKFENSPPIATIEKGKSNIIRWSFSTNFQEAGYTKCIVTYTDPKTKEVIKGEFKNPKQENTTTRTLKINTKVKDQKEATTLAKKKLREKNKKETEATLELQGNINYVTGVTITIKGFGIYDGKYIIQSADHSISSNGYHTSISIRKVLEDY